MAFLNYQLAIHEEKSGIPYYCPILLRKCGMCPSENHQKLSGKDDWLYSNSHTSNLSSPDTFFECQEVLQSFVVSKTSLFCQDTLLGYAFESDHK